MLKWVIKYTSAYDNGTGRSTQVTSTCGKQRKRQREREEGAQLQKYKSAPPATSQTLQFNPGYNYLYYFLSFFLAESL